MFTQIISLVLDVVAGLLGGACMLRLYMQYQRVPFGNPVGRFVFALTDWLVLPLRKVLPRLRIDLASLLAAYLIVLAQYTVMWALIGRGGWGLVPAIAAFGLVRMAIMGLIALLIFYAILSWVQSESPVIDVIDRLCAPLLRPFRRMIPLVGGFDLSPLALLVVLQIALILLGGLQEAVLY